MYFFLSYLVAIVSILQTIKLKFNDVEHLFLRLFAAVISLQHKALTELRTVHFPPSSCYSAITDGWQCSYCCPFSTLLDMMCSSPCFAYGHLPRISALPPFPAVFFPETSGDTQLVGNCQNRKRKQKLEPTENQPSSGFKEMVSVAKIMKFRRKGL